MQIDIQESKANGGEYYLYINHVLIGIYGSLQILTEKISDKVWENLG